ncbi:MAG TPA: HAMP domain-containing sensor histidine kinase, partial [Flavobacterium sp.]
PLSNLIGLLKLTDYMSIDNEELKTIIDGFSKSTYLLNETINDLGEIMLIRDNPYIEKQNVLLLETINNILNYISLPIKEAKPVINIEIQAKEILYTNKTYLESILINLLTNAINYRAKERILQINIKTQKSKDFTTLIIEDNGIGIDLKKYNTKIFGLYQKFHDYPDSKGLGLFLVKSHIESLGGKIEIESEVNLGTKFLLKFKNHQ